MPSFILILVLLFSLVILESIVYFTCVFVELVVAACTFLLKWRPIAIILFWGVLIVELYLFVSNLLINMLFRYAVFLFDIILWLLDPKCLMRHKFGIFTCLFILIWHISHLRALFDRRVLQLIIWYIEYVLVLICRYFTVGWEFLVIILTVPLLRLLKEVLVLLFWFCRLYFLINRWLLG